YTTVFRLAEMYLIRAECRLAAGQLPGAIEDIDMIRRRAQLPLIAETRPLITAEELAASYCMKKELNYLQKGASLV
ncbi:RagB/SusD family nutrient uptake outer membrane protein, partial [Chitinophaga pinensis]